MGGQPEDQTDVGVAASRQQPAPERPGRHGAAGGVPGADRHVGAAQRRQEGRNRSGGWERSASIWTIAWYPRSSAQAKPCR